MCDIPLAVEIEKIPRGDRKTVGKKQRFKAEKRYGSEIAP
jgi:hypothetical protein